MHLFGEALFLITAIKKTSFDRPNVLDQSTCVLMTFLNNALRNTICHKAIKTGM